MKKVLRCEFGGYPHLTISSGGRCREIGILPYTWDSLKRMFHGEPFEATAFKPRGNSKGWKIVQLARDDVWDGFFRKKRPRLSLCGEELLPALGLGKEQYKHDFLGYRQQKIEVYVRPAKR